MRVCQYKKEQKNKKINKTLEKAAEKKDTSTLSNNDKQLLRVALTEYITNYYEKNKGGFAGNTVSYTVANTAHYQLTHLLEKGHAVRNQYGGPDRPGAKKRVSARRHIKPAEIWGNQLLLAKLRSKL